ncbi:SDR family oxidoreductase [Streptomyces sp. NPDC059456]|uniref:SDR family oxidoreductase n=1 Tax=Streptomyces sp. NPDC059456 TaxID=3346838 RepID=UPI00368A2570
MKITVIGGTGLIGSQLVSRLREAGHEVVAASLSTGVDLLTGAGLDRALEGADTVVNVTNSPTFDEASPDFFRTTMGNLLAAGERAGVRHQVILSIVGVDRVPQLDYYRAKTLQEELLREGPTPYSIVRATQFFEFMDAVMSWTADDGAVRLPATPVQPMAAADVVAALADVAAAPALNGTLDVAGPEVFPLDELGRLTLRARKDGRAVVTDARAGMFAAVVGDVLIAGDGARLAPTRYEDWLDGHPR